MGKIKFGRALGLSILGVLSMMAMFAVSAQAAEFQFEKFIEVTKKFEKVAVLLATATGSQEGSGSLLVPGRNLKLTCTSGDVETGSEIINSKEGLAKITFLGCTALDLKTGTELPCTVDNPKALAKLLPVIHAFKEKVNEVEIELKLPFVLAEPDGGTIFTTVLLLGEACPLPEENPVTGSVSAQATTNNSVIDLAVFSEAIQKLIGDKLLFGGFESFINASATLELTGVHAGFDWGVAP
jgi:hypothetical protein